MNHKNVSLSDLFFSFLRLGLSAFGGPAMVAYIRKFAVERKQWIEDGTFKSGVALCQTIPGATTMQLSAFVGLKVKGVGGAVASFIGFSLPAFIIMITLGVIYMRVSSLPLAISAFSGLHVLVVAIVANASFSFGKTSLKKLADFIIAAFAASAFFLKLHPIIVIGASTVIGVVLLSKKSDIHFIPNHVSIFKTVKPILLISISLIFLLILLFFFDRKLFSLTILMMKIDLFAFGGGFASVPLMFHEIVSVREWLPPNVFMDGIALGQVTPGPIVITATFVGYMVSGVIGALVSTIGVFSPSFLMVIGVAPFFDRFKSSPKFVAGLHGILCSFVGLLIAVTVRFTLDVDWDLSHTVLLVLALTALFRKVDILWVVIAGIVYSVFLC